ncbi:MAG: hypothetical protein R6V85_20320 [Polyangia bacterium]
MRIISIRLVAILALALGSCDDGEGDGNPGADSGPPGAFGEVTSAVVVVNPVINEGSVTDVEPGEQRGGVEISVEGLDPVLTDESGLAVIYELPTGSVPLVFDSGEATIEVVQERELYDVVVSYTAQGVEEIVQEIRYPIGGEVVSVPAGESIPDAASEDGMILVLEEGIYPGGFELKSEGVLVFGAWDPDEGALSVIDGDVDVRGGSSRFRGVQVDGVLKSSANSFSAAFCVLEGANITGNSVTLIRNTFTGDQITVPSSNSVLVDNTGIP